MVLCMYYQCNTFSVLTILCGFPDNFWKFVRYYFPVPSDNVGGLLFSLWKHLLKLEFGSIKRKRSCCETDFGVGTKHGGFILGILQASCSDSLLSSGVCRLAFLSVFSVCSLLYLWLAGKVLGRVIQRTWETGAFWSLMLLWFLLLLCLPSLAPTGSSLENTEHRIFKAYMI